MTCSTEGIRALGTDRTCVSICRLDISTQGRPCVHTVLHNLVLQLELRVLCYLPRFAGGYPGAWALGARRETAEYRKNLPYLMGPWANDFLRSRKLVLLHALVTAFGQSLEPS